MPTLNESKEAFYRGVKRYTPSEADRFLAILDDFIAWSSDQTALEHADKDYKQGVVSYRDMSGRIIWSAYPKSADNHGAKLEILPGSADRLMPDARQRALSVLTSITREPISMDTTLRIPFGALRSQVNRDHIKQVIAELVAEMTSPATT